MSGTPPAVAIVTGAAGSIGQAVARGLAETGTRVAVVDRDVEGVERLGAALTAGGHRARAYGCDVADSTEVDRMVGQVADELGPPLALVNNAGLMRDAALTDMSDQDWHSVLDTNVAGSFFLCRAVVPHMRRAKTGRIVAMSSRAALGNANRVNYSSAKAALQGMTRSLAWELGPAGITVNAVAPGHITSAMTEGLAARSGLSYEEYRDAAAADTSVRRVGSPEDVAAAVAYFLSDGAGYTTGQILYVAGKPTI